MTKAASNPYAERATAVDPGARRCWPQCYPEDWIDDVQQSNKGLIRTSCRKCGRFIGYRPVAVKKAK